MKLTFDLPNDGSVHSYCLRCEREAVIAIESGGNHLFYCQACGHTNGRALIIDPSIRWWLDRENEYWHEAAGIFLSNPDGEFLFFERTKYPLGLTVPAGHLDKREKGKEAIKRELREETGIVVPSVKHIGTTDVRGDQCRRGADVHRWHCYVAHVSTPVRVVVDDEGVRPVWLTLDQALARNLTFVVRYIITRYASNLRQAARE